MYNKYLKQQIDIKPAKTDKLFWANYINKFKCSDKQKNELLKELKAFFHWCIKEDILTFSPVENIPRYKIEKSKMKYWLPSELQQFLRVVNEDLTSDNIKIKETAFRIKLLVMIGFSLGDRIGETRALTFGNIDSTKNQISILHSIEYDPNTSDFVGHTKTYQSQRVIDVTQKLIDTILEYKRFLEADLKYNINNNLLIFYNYKIDKPFSDVALRKLFYKYCEIANVSKIRMYDLRHTYVATMMSDGLELYHISERIGHSNYNTTVNKYGHLSTEKRKEIAKITDKYC